MEQLALHVDISDECASGTHGVQHGAHLVGVLEGEDIEIVQQGERVVVHAFADAEDLSVDSVMWDWFMLLVVAVDVADEAYFAEVDALAFPLCVEPPRV